MNLPFLEKNSQFPSMIVYLYSNKIPQSVHILNSLNPEILNFFRIINIDNTQIINIIKKSSTVKLKNIPTVFVIYKSFVDEVDINQLVHNLNIYISKNNEVELSRGNSSKTNNKPYDIIDDEIINTPKLKKINKPIEPRLKTQNHNIGLSSLQIRPPIKGSGHKHMALSSINDSLISNNDDSLPDNLPDNELLDDNLKIPKNLNNEQKKESIANALRQAEKERNEMIEKDEAKQTGLNTNNTTIDLNDVIDDEFNFDNTDKTQEINVDDYRT